MNNNHVTKYMLENLISQNLSTYQIADQLSCSQTNIRYHLRKHGLNTKPIRSNKDPELIRISRNKSSYVSQKKRGEKRKLEAIKLKGGKCTICSYNKNYSALAFHHVEPENKTYNLDIRKFSNTNIDSLNAELEKCILLCNNCHAELHNPTCIL